MDLSLYTILYIATANTQIQRAVNSLTIQLSALAVVMCIFGPGVFIMIVWPKRNVQMTTTAINLSIQHETDTDNFTTEWDTT